MIKKILILFIFLFYFFNFVSASHISGEIFVKENGVVSFDLETDVNLSLEGVEYKDGKFIGNTDLFTNFEKGEWNVYFDFGYFDTILVDIYFPENSIILGLSDNLESYLDFQEKSISVIDSKKDFSLLIKYKLREVKNYFWIYNIFLILILLVVFYFIMKFIFWKKMNQEKLNGVLGLINENERAIIDLLMKGEMRQKKVREKLKIPKASFSRYVINLEKKKLIVRIGEGKNKILKLK